MSISDVLKNAYATHGKRGGYLDILKPKYGSYPCFFTNRELHAARHSTKRILKNAGLYSHVKFHKQGDELGFLDYSYRPTKFYANLEDWMAEKNVNHFQVIYGFQKFTEITDNLTLMDVLKHYGNLTSIDEHKEFLEKIEEEMEDEEDEEVEDEDDMGEDRQTVNVQDMVDAVGGVTIRDITFNGPVTWKWNIFRK